jgi:hypothetical protein
MTFIELELELEFFNYNGSMSVVVNDNAGVIASFADMNPGPVVVKHQIQLPNCLQFVVSNKNYNTDTQVDVDGKILSDKYVKINKLVLGKVPINPEKFYKICMFQTDRNNTVMHDPQWHFNGTITIDLFEDNFIKYLLLINNKFKHK